MTDESCGVSLLLNYVFLWLFSDFCYNFASLKYQIPKNLVWIGYQILYLVQV